MRKLARENAFRTIYSKLFNHEFEGLEASDDLGLNYDRPYYDNIINHFEQNFESLTQKIKDNLKNITIERVYKLDLALIYLAMVEFCFDTPKKVVINEVLELAKKYSTDKSYKFINGFLAGTI